ncbi:MAG: hypothetical protein KME42_18555 [Tildeniella nuda ZEHNDER 1965/U140]|nr:hypothetical protein [Tildeniella nuda ZEHNDER 1965/U140]
MNLIYGAQKFEYTPAPAKLASPRAINWRHQIPGMIYSPTPSLRRPTLQPRAVNWRYQLP